MNLNIWGRFSNLHQCTFKQIYFKISHSCSSKISSYFYKSVFSVKSRLIFNAFYYRHATQKFVHIKINTYSNEMNAQKDFHIFTCISVIKTCVTGLVLKDKNAQKSKRLFKIFFIFPANCFNVLVTIFKKSNPIKYLISLGYLSHNLKTLILKIIVFL